MCLFFKLFVEYIMMMVDYFNGFEYVFLEVFLLFDCIIFFCWFGRFVFDEMVGF